nr:MAG TPA: hypothetical protein [Caudoviricetes sp.]
MLTPISSDIFLSFHRGCLHLIRRLYPGGPSTRPPRCPLEPPPFGPFRYEIPSMRAMPCACSMARFTWSGVYPRSAAMRSASALACSGVYWPIIWNNRRMSGCCLVCLWLNNGFMARLPFLELLAGDVLASLRRGRGLVELVRAHRRHVVEVRLLHVEARLAGVHEQDARPERAHALARLRLVRHRADVLDATVIGRPVLGLLPHGRRSPARIRLLWLEHLFSFHRVCNRQIPDVSSEGGHLRRLGFTG